MSLSPESNYHLANLRSKLLSGTDLTVEELREAYDLMRKARGQAGIAAAEAKTRTSRSKVAAVNSSALLDELDGL